MKTMTRKHIILFLLALFAILYLLLKPTGGELYKPDFKKGFDLYISEAYTVRYDVEIATTTPYSVWSVTDDQLKDDVLHLCEEIHGWRQYEPPTHVMLGSPTALAFFPEIYLDTGKYFYRIKVYNEDWDAGRKERQLDMPIRHELSSPALQVWRVDMSRMPEGENRLDYGRSYSGRDSLNGRNAYGWWSYMSYEELDALMVLADSVSEENAEVVASFGG